MEYHSIILIRWVGRPLFWLCKLENRRTKKRRALFGQFNIFETITWYFYPLLPLIIRYKCHFWMMVNTFYIFYSSSSFPGLSILQSIGDVDQGGRVGVFLCQTNQTIIDQGEMSSNENFKHSYFSYFVPFHSILLRNCHPLSCTSS